MLACRSQAQTSLLRLPCSCGRAPSSPRGPALLSYPSLVSLTFFPPTSPLSLCAPQDLNGLNFKAEPCPPFHLCLGTALALAPPELKDSPVTGNAPEVRGTERFRSFWNCTEWSCTEWSYGQQDTYVGATGARLVSESSEFPALAAFLPLLHPPQGEEREGQAACTCPGLLT